jgi:hypothetical protein
MIATISKRDAGKVVFLEFERDGLPYLLEEAFSMSDFTGFQGQDLKTYRNLPLPPYAAPPKGVLFSSVDRPDSTMVTGKSRSTDARE